MQIVRAIDPTNDLLYLIGKWFKTNDLQERDKLERQIELLSDALVIYRLT